MIKPTAIDHTCLLVKSVDETKDYLETLFGFRCWFRDEARSTLVVESEHVHFFVTEHDGESEFVEKQHISFQVDSVACVKDELKRMGINDFKTGEVSFFKARNYKWCEWRDSNKIRFECVEITDKSC